jgi:hypothetical protein
MFQNLLTPLNNSVKEHPEGKWKMRRKGNGPVVNLMREIMGEVKDGKNIKDVSYFQNDVFTQIDPFTMKIRGFDCRPIAGASREWPLKFGGPPRSCYHEGVL